MGDLEDMKQRIEELEQAVTGLCYHIGVRVTHWGSTEWKYHYGATGLVEVKVVEKMTNETPPR